MKKLGYGLLLGLFLVSFVSAGISISEPLDIYNLGDRIYVSVDGLNGAESGNLNIDLICGNTSTNLLKISARAFLGEDTHSYSIPYKILTKEDLEVEDLNHLVGNCQLTSSIGSDLVSSKTFTISDEIFISASVDKLTYDPAEGINLDVSATLANGELVNGFIEVRGASEFNKAVIEGVVSSSFSMPETIEAGNYDLNISVYELDSNGEILNIGNSVVSFKINQVASLIETSLSDLEVLPGGNFTIGEEIFDQSGKTMNGSIQATLISPINEEISKAVQSGDYVGFNFPTNASAGTWVIRSSFGDLTNQHEFQVMEVQKVEFVVENSILIVKNIGNVEYNKTIEIQIDGENREIELKIELGEERKFSLEAPDGEHNILVGDGENKFQKSVLLSGKVVSIKDFEKIGFFTNYTIIWILLILILGTAGTLFFLKYRKTKKIRGGKIGEKFKQISDKIKVPGKFKSGISNSLNYTNKSPSAHSLDSTKYSSEDKTMMDLTKNKRGDAEAALVLNGEKNISSVICLSVKNYNALGEAGKNALIEMVEKIKKKKGLVDWRGEYIFIVFSPLVTKTYHNEALASKCAFELVKEISEYNKKFKDKLEFNVGVHTGELIASKKDEKLKYTSIGNTISLAKRISDSDVGKVLVSGEIRKKMMRDLKVVKNKEIGKNVIYEVSEIKNRAADAAKLKDLLKRTS